MESLGAKIYSSPSVVSWDKNRIDVFSVDGSTDVDHLYWDGNKWNKDKLSPPWLGGFVSNPTLAVTSWGENRLDVFGVGNILPVKPVPPLIHVYWDGSLWHGEILGFLRGLDFVAATSWSANRLYVVVKARGHIHYKYFDGESWKPDGYDFYPKSPGILLEDNPSVVSWGTNRLDIFDSFFNQTGFLVGEMGLLHQAWVGDSWYPGDTKWEKLASRDITRDDDPEDPEDPDYPEDPSDPETEVVTEL